MNHHDNSLLTDATIADEAFARDTGQQNLSYEQQQEIKYPSSAPLIDIDSDYEYLSGFEKARINSKICEHFNWVLSNTKVRLAKLVAEKEKAAADGKDSHSNNAFLAKRMNLLTSEVVVLKAMAKECADQYRATYGREFDDWKSETKGQNIGSNKTEIDHALAAAQAALAD